MHSHNSDHIPHNIEIIQIKFMNKEIVHEYLSPNIKCASLI
jgi:hypothetical protein